ncbi:MAG: hypothetical protein JWO78_1476 [Micavibrio sp.]|nr:hypothetical protein [Micavibrio sp.]
MDYVSIFDPIPWPEVGLGVFQTATLYVLLILGLKIVGRRVFAEMGPQDMILLLLVAEACDIGLTPEGAGYWGTVASVLTLFFLVGITERIAPLRRLTESKPVILFHQGKLLVNLEKYLLDEGDMDASVRKYGLGSYRDAETLILEDDGNITAILPRPGVREDK